MYRIKNKANKTNTFYLSSDNTSIISQQVKTLTKKTEILHDLKKNLNVRKKNHLINQHDTY